MVGEIVDKIEPIKTEPVPEDDIVLETKDKKIHIRKWWMMIVIIASLVAGAVVLLVVMDKTNTITEVRGK
jgi:hypothetical protein